MSALSCAIDAESAEARIQDMTSKVIDADYFLNLMLVKGFKIPV